jgi:putative aldouronate transport system substrate-binding protein
MRRHGLLMIIAVLALSMVFALNASGAGKSEAAPSAAAASTSAAKALPQVPFKETFEFSILQGMHSHAVPVNRITELIQKKTNTKINWTKVSDTAFREKANITLASGQLPDLVYFYGMTAVPGEWIKQKAVRELTDLLGRAPNIQKYLSKDVMLWMKNPDGNIYQLNLVIEFPYNLSNQIRVDWLKKLGLGMPNTLDEWLKAMRAFRDGDPDGNGKADTIPWVGPFNAWFDAYGITPRTFVDVDGHLVPRQRHPNYKTAVELLAGMFKEKLIDPEFVVRNKDSVKGKELILASKAGAWQQSGSTASSYTSILRQSIPNATFGYAPLIKGPAGQSVQSRDPVGAAGAISIQAKDPEKLMAYWNWIYSDEGLTLMNYGEEGVHYKLVNGKPVVLPPYNESFELNRRAGMAETWVPYVWLADAFMQVVLGGKTLETIQEIDTHTYDCYMKPAAYAYKMYPSVLLDTTEYRNKVADVIQPLTDLEEQVIAGNRTWKDMEDLLAKVKNDLDAITASVDKNYQAVKK